jgi:hypothetical protein
VAAAGGVEARLAVVTGVELDGDGDIPGDTVELRSESDTGAAATTSSVARAKDSRTLSLNTWRS